MSPYDHILLFQEKQDLYNHRIKSRISTSDTSAGFLASHNVTLSFVVVGEILRKSIRNEALIA